MEDKVDWLVIPFDRPVQAGACSIVALASISIRTMPLVISGRVKHEPGISKFPDAQLRICGLVPRTIPE
jgi:hypothetical protein